MINTTTRLVNFLSDGQARKTYRNAIKVIEDLHIFDILREIQSDIPLSTGSHTDGKDIDLMNYHRMYGYMQALNDVEYLVESRESKATIQSPDFGAYDSLMKEGYSAEEIKKMLSNE